MVRQERLVNDAATTLDGGINSSVTSFTVIDGSVFPTEGDFRLTLEQEILLCTSRSSNVLTVTREIEGSTADSYDSGTAVAAIVTQAGLDQFVIDFMDPLAFSRPPNRLLDSSGDVLTKASFTEGNFGTSSSIDDATGGITLQMEARADPNTVALYKTAPATPYSVIARVLVGPNGNNSATGNGAHLGFRESSSTKLSFISYRYYTDTFTQYAADWDDLTAAPAASSQEPTCARPDYWLKIEDDGTDLNYYKSSNGYHWWLQHTELRGFHFTTGPNEVWFGGENQGDPNNTVHLLAWIEE